MLRTYRSLETYCATLWWTWFIFSFFRVMEHRWNKIDRGKPKYAGKNLPQCHFVHHKSHRGWPRNRTRSSAAKGRRLTAWAMARPTLYVCLGNKLADRTMWSNQSFPEFNLLLISSRIKFWFVRIFPKDLNSATFSKHLLYILCCDCLAFCSRDKNTYLVFSAFTSRPAYLLVTKKKTLCFSL
jgi:hypothetical protein